MNRQTLVVRRHLRTAADSAQVGRPTYFVTLTETGKWLFAPGSDFLFAYLETNWPADVQKAVTAAFEDALKMSSTIKASVKKSSGDDVVNGLYLLNQEAMTKAMNEIDGMGMTTANNNEEQGSGTAMSITQDFFTAILGGLGGDVAPMLTYLTTQMGDLQAQTMKSSSISTFGTVIGMISTMPVLNIPVTTFQYVFSSSQTAEWFVKVPCGSVEHQSYDYKYTVVEYNYVKPSSK